MPEAHVVGKGLPSWGPVAMLSLTARRKESGAGGLGGSEAGETHKLVILKTHWAVHVLACSDELVQASPLLWAKAQARAMDEPGAQAGQPAIGEHEGAQPDSCNSVEMRKGQDSHLRALSRNICLLCVVPSCEVCVATIKPRIFFFGGGGWCPCM